MHSKFRRQWGHMCTIKSVPHIHTLCNSKLSKHLLYSFYAVIISINGQNWNNRMWQDHLRMPLDDKRSAMRNTRWNHLNHRWRWRWCPHVKLSILLCRNLWGLLSINPLIEAMYCILKRGDSRSNLLNNHRMWIHICLI